MPEAMQDAPPAPPLAGLKVIDAGSFIAAPAAATVMADLGAEVIKLEPPAGDPFRALRNAPGNPPCEVDYGWLADNRGKRGLALDLKTKPGREVLYRLIADTDVFVTNAPLGARERLGIGYEDLAARNGRLIYASLTAYGERGPERLNTGFDSTALWARSGLMDMVRPAPDSPPAKSLPGMGDHPTALTLYAAIATALYRRERTGRGGYVATNLMANGLWWNALHAQAMLCGAEFERRPAREDAPSALHNFYRTADGRWLQLVVIPEDKRWPRLARAVGRPELIDDPRFAARTARHANANALVQVLDEAFATADLAAWRRRLDEHEVAYGVVSTLRDLPEDRQMHESGAFTPIGDDQTAGARHVVSSPLWLDGPPHTPPSRPPDLGEHSADILRERGFSEGEIEKLYEAGALGGASGPRPGGAAPEDASEEGRAPAFASRGT